MIAILKGFIRISNIYTSRPNERRKYAKAVNISSVSSILRIPFSTHSSLSAHGHPNSRDICSLSNWNGLLAYFYWRYGYRHVYVNERLRCCFVFGREGPQAWHWDWRSVELWAGVSDSSAGTSWNDQSTTLIINFEISRLFLFIYNFCFENLSF